MAVIISSHKSTVAMMNSMGTPSIEAGAIARTQQAP